MRRLLKAGIGGVVVLSVLAVSAGCGKKIEAISREKSVRALISEGRLDDAIEKTDELSLKGSDAAVLGRLYFEIASAYEKNNELIKARDVYAAILTKYQSVENILEVQEGLGRLNVKILFSPVITDSDISYTIEPGDSLTKIAKKFGATVDLLKTANSLTSDVIHAGSKLKVPKARYNILVDKSQNLLTLFFEDGRVFKVYRVATGGDNSTPEGKFKIINKIKDPVWYTQGAIAPAESPDNILGSRWLGISKPGYGIHGTTDPDSVGKQETKGCIRMLNSDVEELYTMVPLDTEVTIVD